VGLLRVAAGPLLVIGGIATVRFWLARRSCRIRSRSMLDVLYIAITVAGFLALWGVVKACEKV
jgi:hypothetical protein